MKSIDTRIIKGIVALAVLAFTVYLFIIGRWGWGIFMILVSAVFIVAVMFSMRIVLAFIQLRKQNMQKAKHWLEKINPAHVWKHQKGYYYFLLGTAASQSNNFSQSEKSFREALRHGLKMDHNKAMAYLNLAAISGSRRKKREAIHFINEAKKYDTKGLIKNEIKDLSKRVQSL